MDDFEGPFPSTVEKARVEAEALYPEDTSEFMLRAFSQWFDRQIFKENKAGEIRPGRLAEIARVDLKKMGREERMTQTEADKFLSDVVGFQADYVKWLSAIPHLQDHAEEIEQMISEKFAAFKSNNCLAGFDGMEIARNLVLEMETQIDGAAGIITFLDMLHRNGIDIDMKMRDVWDIDYATDAVVADEGIRFLLQFKRIGSMSVPKMIILFDSENNESLSTSAGVGDGKRTDKAGIESMKSLVDRFKALDRETYGGNREKIRHVGMMIQMPGDERVVYRHSGLIKSNNGNWIERYADQLVSVGLVKERQNG